MPRLPAADRGVPCPCEDAGGHRPSFVAQTPPSWSGNSQGSLSPPSLALLMGVWGDGPPQDREAVAGGKAWLGTWSVSPQRIYAWRGRGSGETTSLGDPPGPGSALLLTDQPGQSTHTRPKLWMGGERISHEARRPAGCWPWPLGAPLGSTAVSPPAHPRQGPRPCIRPSVRASVRPSVRPSGLRGGSWGRGEPGWRACAHHMCEAACGGWGRPPGADTEP